MAVRIAKGPKCALDPRVVCALRYGSKSYADSRLACSGAVVDAARCASYESIPYRGSSATRETPPRPQMAGADRVNRWRAEM